MKVVSEEYGPFAVISIGLGDKCLWEIEDVMQDDVNMFDNTSYLDVWNKICEDVFGSWFIRSKNIKVESYVLFYPLSRFEILADQQLNHFNFTADIANLELERIDSLVAERNKKKYGEQLKLKVEG